jgi:hypothetical protein
MNTTKSLVAAAAMLAFAVGAVAAGTDSPLPLLQPSLVKVAQRTTAPRLDIDAPAFSVDDPPMSQVPAPQAPGAEGKSTGRAVLYSLVLPGWGQYYLGETRNAWTFFAAEAAVWTSFFVFELQGHLRKNGYEEFAQDFAGIQSDSHSDDFWGVLTQYNSSKDYEDELKREGRFAIFPEGGADALERYFIENRIGDYEPWEWQSAEIRRAYQDRRSASKRAFRRALYAAATGIANRAAAAFFAVRSTRAIQDPADNGAGFRVEFGSPTLPVDDEFRTGVSIIKQF